MNLLDTIRGWFVREVILTHYVSADRFTPDRSWLQAYVQGADQDLDSASRTEILRKARWFEKNNALAQKILDLIETNVVGGGINPTPLSADQEWSKKALNEWESWCARADISSRQSFYSLQAVAVRSQAIDGEVFIWLRDDAGFPRIQLIEAHEIAPGYRTLPQGWRDIDGIICDERDRPMYYVRHDLARATITEIPATDIIHIYEPSRAGQHRGLSLFHAVLHTLHDLDDLQRYEMLAAKTAALDAKVIKSRDDASGVQTIRPVVGGSVTATPRPPQEDDTAYYEKAFAGRIRRLKPGDEIQQTENNRPSGEMRAFWENLTETICKGVGVSFAAVQDYRGGWGGAALRAAVVSDVRFYDLRTKSLASQMQRIWERVIPGLHAAGLLTAALPEDWRKVRWQPPRRPTVDIGRDSQALLREAAAGLRTYRDSIGEGGGDWQEVLTQRILEQKFISDKAKELGVPSGLVMQMLGAAGNTNAFAEKASEAVDGKDPEATPASTP